MKKGKSKDNDFYETSKESVEKLWQSNMNAFREIMDIEFDYACLWREFMTAHIERLSNVEDVSDVIAVESGLATEYSQKFSEAHQQFNDAILSAMKKQQECLNLPMNTDSLLPYIKGYEDILNKSINKMTTNQSDKN